LVGKKVAVTKATPVRATRDGMTLHNGGIGDAVRSRRLIRRLVLVCGW
jgi:hypothetical protein